MSQKARVFLVENREKPRGRWQASLELRFFMRFGCATEFLGKLNPFLTSLNYDFELGMGE